MNFIVVPINRGSDMGFWVQAHNAIEARLLVSLNIPGMAESISDAFASCEEDHRYSPEYGAITCGSGRTYTITRRRTRSTGLS